MTFGKSYPSCHITIRNSVEENSEGLVHPYDKH
jgi:hypothetical protein